MKVIWQGAITFGLVTIPIKLYAATESHALGFTLLHATCHTPLKYHRWCPHCEKEVVWEETVKGLNSAAGFIRRELSARVKMRKTPELKFISDDSIEQSARISKLLSNLSKGDQPQAEISADNSEDNADVEN